MTFDPFNRLSCKHGAPMGRVSSAPGNFVDYTGELYARHQGGGEGYDSGGAYWGLPSNVWAVWTRGGESVAYVRAGSATAAKALAQGGWKACESRRSA